MPEETEKSRPWPLSITEVLKSADNEPRHTPGSERKTKIDLGQDCTRHIALAAAMMATTFYTKSHSSLLHSPLCHVTDADECLQLKGNNAPTIHGELVEVYGNNAPSYDTVVKWRRGFQCGEASLNDEERSD
ncbi:hypothetical protein ANN_19089 [Periplaneta americana]|uniref:Mos1 transposase HTH domain-containing protein n=1 Tax=Periplaneta americana TaxID=6978 RepID=A0ABQ8SRW0_PERAM|nr:hypothetical protein ANN_19089 [Periplaneta americana]